MRALCYFRGKSVLLGDILAEVTLGKLGQGAVGAEFVDGVVDGLHQGRGLVALAQRNCDVRSFLGLCDDLEVCVRMDIQVS